MSTYKNQKRSKKTNVARLLGDTVKKCKGPNAPERCYFPNKGQRCKDNEKGTYLCDARKLTVNQIILDDNIFSGAKVRYFLNRLRIDFGAAVKLRKRYSAYATDSNGLIIFEGRRGKLFPKMKQGFSLQTSNRENKMDFNVPLKCFPVPNPNSTAKLAVEWMTGNSRRYHYQAEARMLKAAIDLGTAYDYFVDLYNTSGIEAIVDLIDQKYFSNLEICLLLITDEMNIMFREQTGRNNFGDFTNLPTTISPPNQALFYYRLILLKMYQNKDPKYNGERFLSFDINAINMKEFLDLDQL